mmetsp:Transcript_41277/g.63617  ORF Transcript_41277/g.63617 Transcript_41277/m.63617 type:complete len:121 (+) Transcript_41277:35-397(+)
MKLEIQQLQTQAEQYNRMRMEGDLKELQEFDAVKRQERLAEDTKRKHDITGGAVSRPKAVQICKFKKPGYKAGFEDRIHIELYQKNTILAGLQRKCCTKRPESKLSRKNVKNARKSGLCC